MGPWGIHEPPVINEENQPWILCVTGRSKCNKHKDVRHHICGEAATSGKLRWYSAYHWNDRRYVNKAIEASEVITI